MLQYDAMAESQCRPLISSELELSVCSATDVGLGRIGRKPLGSVTMGWHGMAISYLTPGTNNHKQPCTQHHHQNCIPYQRQH